MKKIIPVLLVMVLVLAACGSNELYEVDRVDEESLGSASDNETMEAENEAVATGSESSGSEPTETEEAKEDEDSQEEPEQEKIMAPDFTLMDREGNPVSLSDYRGKIVFLNFFTTWCTYCDLEMPEFEKASKEYEEDLVILLVDVYTQERISEEEVYAWYDERNLTMELVIDTEGVLTRDYPIQAFPTTFFIDRDGSVLAYFPGAMTEDIIAQVVNEFK